jgi:uncharacterized protein (DUF305 family)
MKHPKQLAAVLSAGALMFTLTACGEGIGSDEPRAKETATNGDVFNGTDVDFATDMIPHHAQALVMVDMTSGRELSPEVEQMTEDIRTAQGPEIEQMVDWLTAWDKPIPETMRDHANAHGHGMSGHDMDGDDAEDMPGMMTDDEMADLEAAKARDFEHMWLQMMIEHHQGAIEMARDEQEHGVFGPAKKLAESIESSQQDEIDRMQELLAS